MNSIFATHKHLRNLTTYSNSLQRSLIQNIGCNEYAYNIRIKLIPLEMWLIQVSRIIHQKLQSQLLLQIKEKHTTIFHIKISMKAVWSIRNYEYDTILLKFLNTYCWYLVRTYIFVRMLWCFLFYQKMCTLFQKMQFRDCFLKMFCPLKGWYVLF